MRFFWGFIFICSITTHAWGEDVAAVPKVRRAPEYPAACRPTGDEDRNTENVFVMFEIDRNGETKNVRVREATNPCFNEVAIAAVRSWSYEPRRRDGQAIDQSDMEVMLSFRWEEPSELDDFDASPLSRVPPQYPEKCMRRAKNEEFVVVRFDVAADGATTNLSVAETSNKCLNNAALDAVSHWRYRPRIVGGKPVARLNVETKITFQLVSSLRRSPEFTMRPAVAKRLERAQKKLRFEKDPNEVLADLDELERLYGADFSRVELSTFHQLRGAARMQARDYRGALDDFRIVQASGVSDPETAEAVASLIVTLETALEQSERQPAESE